MKKKEELASSPDRAQDQEDGTVSSSRKIGATESGEGGPAARVTHLLADYDGTLAPIDVPLEASAIPAPLVRVLRSLSDRLVFAVISAKGFDFIHPRVPYAAAWGCVSGLDIRFRDHSESVQTKVDVEAALGLAKAMLGQRAAFEEKRDATSLLGFSVDWRGLETPAEIGELVSTMSDLGLHVDYDAQNPFADFFCAPPQKGTALRRIVRATKTEGGVSMFIGDSQSDNSAFAAADISIGVDHGQRLDALRCAYFTTPVGLVPFLIELSARGMSFAADLPGLRARGT